jgi:hypothetical protein
MVHARRGQWPGLSPFMHAIEVMPADHDAYHSLAHCSRGAGPEAYHRVCARVCAGWGIFRPGHRRMAKTA